MRHGKFGADSAERAQGCFTLFLRVSDQPVCMHHGRRRCGRFAKRRGCTAVQSANHLRVALYGHANDGALLVRLKDFHPHFVAQGGVGGTFGEVMTRLLHTFRVTHVTTKLLVIDGHSMAYRAFFALPADSFTVAGGQHTNAVYGFMSMMAKTLETERPTHVVVAFDASSKSFRTDKYPEYKGTRDKTPAEFIGQVELIGAILNALGIKQLEVENYEADDIIATLATQAAEEGFEVLVASGDRDTFQLVNDEVTVIYPGRSTSDLTYMTPEKVEERYGLPPAQYPELAALVGETSDNLPGVPGVGPKTAAQWLIKYGGLTRLLEQADSIGGKRGQALRDNIETVKLNRELNHLLTDMDLELSPDQCVADAPDMEGLESLFDTLEFTKLRERIYTSMAPLWSEEVIAEAEALGATEVAEEREPQEIVIVNEQTDLPKEFGRFLNEDGTPVDVAVWGAGRLAATNADLTGLALAGPETILVLDPADLTAAQEEALGQFLKSHPSLIAHGAKGLIHALATRGWQLNGPAFDTELAAYLCRPGGRGGYDLDKIAQQYLERQPRTGGDGELFSEAFAAGATDQPNPVQEVLASSAETVLALKTPLTAELVNQEELALLSDLELPVMRALAEMEADGIAIDVDYLTELRTEFADEVATAAQDAYNAIGHETNLGSPKQLQVVLFDELGMPKTRKTKTGYTTDAEALADLYVKTSHPFLEALLRHRDRIKLVQMIDGLLAEVQPDGRIHTTFQQTVAATGRLASSDPNLQNIPARTEAGLRIREAFVAGPGYENLMSVDYSQVEMRIMAHLSKDQNLIDAFLSGEDLHKTMAASVFGIPLDEVTGEDRDRIKATSYGLAYGLSPFGLSRQLGTSVEEARNLHAQYFERFGGIRRYLQEVVEEARRSGYTETILGRRRYFPELNSSVRRVADMAERAALNAPIQGSAADIMKLAMIEVDRQLKDGHYGSRVLLQVHDELVLEVAAGEQQEVEDLVRNAMGSSVTLSVPLDVAVGVGHSWRAAAH